MIHEKWKVARTQRAATTLNMWNNEHPLYTEQKRTEATASGDDKNPDFFYSDRGHDHAKRDEYTEISFEDFMKYCQDYTYLNKTLTYEIY
jgi:hypothetical protein